MKTIRGQKDTNMREMMSYFQSCKGLIKLDVCLVKTTAANKESVRSGIQALTLVSEVWKLA